MNDTTILIIGFIVILILMIICKTVYNAIAKIADNRKENQDRSRGAYKETKPENLADRFK